MEIPRDLLVSRRDGTNQPDHNADGRPGGKEISLSVNLPPHAPLPAADESLSNRSGSFLDPGFLDLGHTYTGSPTPFPDGRLPRSGGRPEHGSLSVLSGTFLDPSPVLGVSCPRCGSENTRPSLRKTRSGSFLKSLWSKPYRCRACDHKFLGRRWKV